MIKFLAQKIDRNRIAHDFVFELLNSIDYQNWRNPKSMDYRLCDYEHLATDTKGKFKNFVPVGTVEYFFEFLEKYVNPKAKEIIKPLNVPESLFPYAGREIMNMSSSQKHDHPFFKNKMLVFVKSNDTIKYVNNGITEPSHISLKFYGNIQVSDIIPDIKAEYRVFVYKYEIVGIQYYSGDFFTVPDMDFIKECVSQYDDAPVAYTIDIAVCESGKNLIVECHEFFSCGLYGFSDYSVLPYMFLRTYQDIKKRLTQI